jgi:hypothetical protein
MFEGVAEQIETEEQEEHQKKAGQASEGASKPSANYHRLEVLCGGADESFGAHGSSLLGAASRSDGILDRQELEISEVRRCVFLLPGCAADAARSRAVEFAVGLDQDYRVAGRIHAMPLFPCFDDHDARPSLPACWDRGQGSKDLGKE